MIKSNLRIAAFTFSLTCCHAAFAQQSQDNTIEADINSELAKITSQDPVQRMIGAQESLQSDDQMLREAALDRILSSDDGHVREIGFTYLASVQKQFIVTVVVPQDQLANVADSGIKSFLANLSALTIIVGSVDPHTNVISATTNPESYHDFGAITQDGISFAFTPINSNNGCALDLRGYAEGLLRGALVCADASFSASMPLP